MIIAERHTKRTGRSTHSRGADAQRNPVLFGGAKGGLRYENPRGTLLVNDDADESGLSG
jgi:hypothetical protein